MRDYRFHGFTEDGAASMADALAEDGFTATSAPSPDPTLNGWIVTAMGPEVSEGLLEALAHFHGGHYEGEGLSFG